MSFSLIYLANRFVYRIAEFLRHWYINGFLILSRRTVDFLERLDRVMALKITLRYWLRPLYQDYTVLGYILGFSLRTLRIIAAGALYLLVIIIAAAIYLLWATGPVYIVYRGFII